MATGDKPVKVFKHRAISASVFENSTQKDGQTQTFFKVSVRRTYKDGEEFRSNANFGRDEIPIVRLLLDRAWQFILEAEATAKLEDEPEGDEQAAKKTKK